MIGAIPQNVFNELYPYIGALTVNWAVAESQIEHLVLILHRTKRGPKGESRIPKFFKKKVRYVRRALPALGLSPEMLQTSRQVLSDLTALSTIRHAVTHGAMAGYDPAKDKVRFIRLDIEPSQDTARPDIHWYSVDEIKNAALRGRRAGRTAMRVLAAVAYKLLP